MKVKKTFGRTIRINQDQVERLKFYENQILKLKVKASTVVLDVGKQSEREDGGKKVDVDIEEKLKDLSIDSQAKKSASVETLVESTKQEEKDSTNIHSVLLDTLGDNDLQDNPKDIPIENLVEKDLKDLISLCGQTKIYKFQEYFDSFPHKKIGEASYSDVYLSKSNQAIKVIPIGQENQLSIHAAWLELTTTRQIGNVYQRDDPLSNFVQLEKCGVVKGLYHSRLLKLWDHYDNEKGSENLNPREYTQDQVYLILSMEYAGSDLESTLLISNMSRVYSLLLQTVLALCQAEIQLEFEHRDLHWGNVLICSCPQTTLPFVIHFKDGQRIVNVPTAMIKVTLIDFTLARFCEQGMVLFNDLEQDPELFTGDGLEKGGDIQFDVYRWMREAVAKDWTTSCFKTNIYVLND